MKKYEEKKQDLYKKMQEYVAGDLCLAFSGGVDSSLILALAKKCKNEQKSESKLYAVTFDTMLHPSCDLETAKNVAEEMGAIHEVLAVNELEQEDIRFNPENRCYLCKKNLFTKLKKFAEIRGISQVLEGTNQDDLSVYRPGLQAVKELGIKSPLAETGFTKEEVRRFAGELGVSVAERPSTPCLATRLPYGTEIRMEILEKIELGEDYLKQEGFPVVRLRVHQDIARIEIPQKDFAGFLKKSENITMHLKKLGFFYITLDLQGFRSGSMDEHLSPSFDGTGRKINLSRKNT